MWCALVRPDGELSCWLPCRLSSSVSVFSWVTALFLLCVFEIESHYVFQTDLELMCSSGWPQPHDLLASASQLWDYRRGIPLYLTTVNHFGEYNPYWFQIRNVVRKQWGYFLSIIDWKGFCFLKIHLIRCLHKETDYLLADLERAEMRIFSFLP